MFDKPDVHFEHPAKGPHHCSQCQYYLGQSCKIVSGLIDPEDWCDHFKMKENDPWAVKPKPVTLSSYGVELLLDMYECDPSKFNRLSLDEYFTQLCEIIEMNKCEVHFWDDLHIPPDKRQTMPKTKGTSAVCFIITSNITVHTLDILKEVYVNIFSCKSFRPEPAEDFSRKWFSAGSCDSRFIVRGSRSISDPNEPPDPAKCGH